MLLTATGMACLVATDNSGAVVAGMALFGVGLGGAQNASLAVIFDRAAHDRVAQVSVIWNLAYDAGMGFGAIAFGMLSGIIGYSMGFAAVAAVLFTAVPFAWAGQVQPKRR
jgi:predicted MFS family arabinose efflux permease